MRVYCAYAHTRVGMYAHTCRQAKENLQKKFLAGRKKINLGLPSAGLSLWAKRHPHEKISCEHNGTLAFRHRRPHVKVRRLPFLRTVNVRTARRLIRNAAYSRSRRQPHFYRSHGIDENCAWLPPRRFEITSLTKTLFLSSAGTPSSAPYPCSQS